MNFDLTFFTNEPGRNMRDRFHALLGDHTRAFDCLVGYFYLSGFHLLHPALEKTEKIRILIGLKTNQAAYDLIQQANEQRPLDFVSHAEAKEQVPREILDELERSEESAPIENGVNQFVAWCREGKLEIKVYPSTKIHAKVYILTFIDRLFERGHVITGSSNLSQSGLQDNLEFNVELKNRADYDFALTKFNELWADAVDVTEEYVETIKYQSPFAAFSPHELYLKFLYEYFRGELNRPDELESLYVPNGFRKLKYQSDAVLGAKKILEDYGGVFLSDVVGLGKTYMAALLAQELDGRNLVIAPPALLDANNPGSWRNVFGDFRLHADFQSIGKLDDLAKRDLSKYANVFVDEAHRFRTETNETYERLAQICRGKRVILVTATPLNNTPRDILSQIKLFQPAKNSTIPGIKNLETFFSRLEKRLRGLDRQRDREEYFRTVQQNAKETREQVLKHLMIRRTRSEITRYYAEDLAAQRLRFPEVKDPVPLFYQFNAIEDRIFTNTIERLTKEFTYARYRPLTYFAGQISAGELTGQRNLAKFMKILLVKRLESSFHAFGLSLDRFIHSYERFIAEYHQGVVYLSKKHAGKIFDLLEDGDLESVERLLDDEKAERFDAASFNDGFLNDLESDLRLLRAVRDEWRAVRRDPKFEAFKAALQTDENFKAHKLILFTESKETAEYLTGRLTDELHAPALLFTGQSGPEARHLVIQNFDARAFQPLNNYRILVTTDTLAEGVNLHAANTVINYDIPWNPTRMIQRVGRVNRVDTAFTTICTYNFFPTQQSNDQIKLKESAEAKIQAFIEMLGADSRLLTEGEEIKSHDLFAQLLSKRTITGEGDDEESEMEYLKIIRDVRDQQPELFERIKRLPRKARSAKADGNDGGRTLLTYFRKGALEKFFLANDGNHAREVDFLAAAKRLQCQADEPRLHIGGDFYQLLDHNKEAFVIATSEAQDDEAPASNSRDHATKILRRLRSNGVRRCTIFTEDDEAYLADVARLLENGALPRPTTKKVWAGIKDEINPLNILGILRRDVAPQFFEQTRAEARRNARKPREVILSAYLVGE